jgi:S1-C subfamily serine protease
MQNKKIRIFAILAIMAMLTVACGFFRLPFETLETLETLVPQLQATLEPRAPEESLQERGANPPTQDTRPYQIPAKIPTPLPPAQLNPVLPETGLLQTTLEQLYANVNPGVVSLKFSTQTGQSGQGTGFVIDKKGHIVTNCHVACDANYMEVHFPSGLKVEGHTIGRDPDSDLAVVKVDVEEAYLVPLPLGDSSQAPVGMQVVAIGNPFGLSGTMTIGIISARGRTLESMRQSDSGGTFTAPDLIQTDAAINPGNSGGPLLNLAGEVIGVNRAIATGQNILGSSSGNIGIGYAISSNIVRRVVPSLIEYGTYDYPYLGIAALSDDYMTLETCDKLELPQCTGAYVSNVVNGGPGDRAGLHGARTDQNGNIGSGGDLIVAIDGEAVVIFNDLVTHITLNNYPGETVTLTVIRNGEQVDIPVTLGRRP